MHNARSVALLQRLSELDDQRDGGLRAQWRRRGVVARQPVGQRPGVVTSCDQEGLSVFIEPGPKNGEQRWVVDEREAFLKEKPGLIDSVDRHQLDGDPDLAARPVVRLSALLYDLHVNAIATILRKGAWEPSHSESASTTPPLSSEATSAVPTSVIYWPIYYF